MHRSFALLALLATVTAAVACSSSDEPNNQGASQDIQFLKCGGFDDPPCPEGLRCDAPAVGPGEETRGFCKRIPDDQKPAPKK